MIGVSLAGIIHHASDWWDGAGPLYIINGQKELCKLPHLGGERGLITHCFCPPWKNFWTSVQIKSFKAPPFNYSRDPLFDPIPFLSIGVLFRFPSSCKAAAAPASAAAGGPAATTRIRWRAAARATVPVSLSP